MNPTLTMAMALCAVYMFGKGALMILGRHVPASARTIEDPASMRAWCRENGRINFIWGADFLLYGASGLVDFTSMRWLYYVWAAVAIAIAVACCYASYRVNRKYLR